MLILLLCFKGNKFWILQNSLLNCILLENFKARNTWCFCLPLAKLFFSVNPKETRSFALMKNSYSPLSWHFAITFLPHQFLCTLSYEQGYILRFGPGQPSLTDSSITGMPYQFTFPFQVIGLAQDFVLQMLGIEPRASHMLGRHSTTELYPQSFIPFFLNVWDIRLTPEPRHDLNLWSSSLILLSSGISGSKLLTFYLIMCKKWIFSLIYSLSKLFTWSLWCWRHKHHVQTRATSKDGL